VARVVLTRDLGQQFAGGETEFEIDASSVRGILRALEASFPGLGAAIENGMAIAIDGEIHQDPYLESVADDSEVFVLPKIGGG